MCVNSASTLQLSIWLNIFRIPDPDSADWPFLLEEGDRDDRVLIVRGLLQAFGFGALAPSEFYSADVSAAVKALQRAEKLTEDGIWGPTTHSHARARIKAELER